MVLREKHIGRYTYVYLVESVRENGKTRQRTVANLGRKEVVGRRWHSGAAGALGCPP